MATETAATPYCAEVARAESASLIGTGTRAMAFLLVEHRGEWGARAVDENDLPTAAQSWIGAETAALGEQLGGKARALLIRREAATTGPLACFLAVTQETRRELYRFEVDSHEELPALSLSAGLAAGALGRHRSDQPLTLVCGNGHRDRCCARFGVPTYRALAAVEPEMTWLSTHQGGHRHAGTGLWLPEGVSYGYLQPGEAPALLTARAGGAIHRRCFRGRTFHPEVAQAADALLRQVLGEEALDPWRLQSHRETAPGEWQIHLGGPAGDYLVRLDRGAERALVSCSPAKEKSVDHFALRSWERLEEPR